MTKLHLRKILEPLLVKFWPDFGPMGPKKSFIFFPSKVIIAIPRQRGLQNILPSDEYPKNIPEMAFFALGRFLFFTIILKCHPLDHNNFLSFYSNYIQNNGILLGKTGWIVA